MSENSAFDVWKIGKLMGVSAITLYLNYWLTNYLSKRKQENKLHLIKKPTGHHKHRPSIYQKQDVNKAWGTFKLVDKVSQDDHLLRQLEMMSLIICPLVKVNNLIVDLELEHAQTFPCPLVANQIKRVKEQPFLSKGSLVKPGAFIIQNCVFKAGQTIQCEKKFLRAGARNTQYFNSKEVRADIVVLGKVAPGINNIIRQLVFLLRETYQVQSVKGVKFSFRGYYEENQIIDLTLDDVKTIHHFGGCAILGVSDAECRPEKIVDSFVARRVNQVYLIGGNDTVGHMSAIYQEIKRRHLNIAICQELKAINKDIAYVDTCFGFQSAVQETQRFVEEAYSLSKSNFNSVGKTFITSLVLIKVPGRYSGFLAMDAVRAARNANICLVPEFPYDLYGENGLLKYITERIKLKGYCIIVYSQGASYVVRDIEPKLYAQTLYKKDTNFPSAFDDLLKKAIEDDLTERKVHSHHMYFFDATSSVRSVPANSFDTKLCCQIALASVQGLMCGYTNFAIGHLKNRVAMVPSGEMMRTQTKASLSVCDENWQRLLANTGQPSFLNEEISHAL